MIFLLIAGFGKSFAQPGVGIPFGFTIGTPGAPAFAGNIVNAAVNDNTMIIISPTGFNFPFAGTNYPLILASTNGWAALLSATDISAVAASTTNSVAIAISATSFTVTSATGISIGMYVSGPGILTNSGYAQVSNVVGNVITVNYGFTAAAGIGATYNFYNLLPAASLASALPTNQ